MLTPAAAQVLGTPGITPLSLSTGNRFGQLSLGTLMPLSLFIVLNPEILLLKIQVLRGIDFTVLSNDA